MARVELSSTAVEDLERLIRSHSLPRNTRARVKDSIRHLETFPLLGPSLHGRWGDFRFVLGPWRWMIMVYVYFPEDERVVIVTIQDGRSSAFAS